MKRKFLGLICLMLVILPCTILMSACKKDKEPVSIVGNYELSNIVMTASGSSIEMDKEEYDSLVAKENKTQEEEMKIQQVELFFGISTEIKEDNTFVMTQEGEVEEATGTWSLEGETLNLDPTSEIAEQMLEDATATYKDGVATINLNMYGAEIVLTFVKK